MVQERNTTIGFDELVIEHEYFEDLLVYALNSAPVEEYRAIAETERAIREDRVRRAFLRNG